jgi:hypothetical protein
MINLTSDIQIVDLSSLSSHVHDAIDKTLQALIQRYGDEPPSVIWTKPHGFTYMFGPRNILKSTNFDERFVRASALYTQSGSQNKGAPSYFNLLKGYGLGLMPASSGLNSVKQGVKMLIVQLRDQGAIVLPAAFETGPHFRPATNDNELLKFINRFAVDENGVQIVASNFGDKEARRIFYYMPRIVRATTWNSIEDFNIQDYSKLHAAQLRSHNANDKSFNKSVQVPWTLFLQVLLEYFPDRVSFTASDLERYSAWTLSSKGINDVEFENFSQRVEPVATPKRRALRRGNRDKNNFSEEKRDELTSLTTSMRHDDALAYFEKYKAGKTEREIFDGVATVPSYVGREQVKVGELAQHWIKAIRKYRQHRQDILSYESDSVDGSLAILYDYLFLYLPWWMEIYPNSAVQFPLYPRNFSRLVFVDREEAVPIDVMPEGLLKLIALRRKGATTKRSAIIDIEKFFEFIRDKYVDDEQMAGALFKNPIRRRFDAPRISRPGKTNKVVFPKDSYPWLVRYAYAVEAFGQYLQEQCLSRKISYTSARKYSQESTFAPQEFGFIPFVRYRGNLVIVKEIPNVYSWETRTVKRGNKSVDIFIPHLTTHRSLTFAIESGLRMASILWLDRRNWNERNHHFDPSGTYLGAPDPYPYTYDIYVNTDKTKDKGFDSCIVFRAHALLLRETRFQESINEAHINNAVPYKGRQNSRFGSIVPLFRSAISQGPVSEKYYDVWLEFLIAFEKFYQSATGMPTRFTEEVIQVDENGVEEVRIRTINTPHACRATFATNRQGLMETSDIAQVIGHEDIITTQHYQAMRVEDVKKALEKGDRVLFEEAEIFDAKSPVHIRADKEESSLVRSYRKDRAKALIDFSFMPAVVAWNTADSNELNEEKIEILRHGPMSLVRFLPTHICPVGMQCPEDVIKAAGAPQRCGICPLAMKCIDHLPAIGAKKNALVEQIRYKNAQCKAMEKAGENTAADELYDQVEADTNELIGWQLSEEILVQMLKSRQSSSYTDSDVQFLVDQPEIVRHHLTRVVKRSEPVDFMLQRIAEGNAYPSLQTPELRAVAAGIRKKIMAGSNTDNFMTDLGSFSVVAEAAGMLKSVMRMHGLTLKDVRRKLLASNAVPSAALVLTSEA